MPSQMLEGDVFKAWRKRMPVLPDWLTRARDQSREVAWQRKIFVNMHKILTFEGKTGKNSHYFYDFGTI